MSEDKPQRKKPGPTAGPKLGEKVVQGYLIGRNKVVVPPEEVEQLASIGLKDTEIADWFGVTDNSLRYNFKDILVKGRSKMKMSLRQAMFRNAVNENNSTMQIWLSKNYLAMSDNPLDSEENLPLPWNENEDDTTSIEEYDEENDDGQEDQIN